MLSALIFLVTVIFAKTVIWFGQFTEEIGYI